MKTMENLFKYSLMLLTFVTFTGCSSDDEGGTPATLDLSLSGEGVENAGADLYEYQVETGNVVSVIVNVDSSADLEDLEISKTVNNQLDDSFGTNGTMTVPASGSDLTYTFNYTPVEGDVDQLVNFTFDAATTTGVTESADLTVTVTLSPIDNLTRRRWMKTSIYWVNGEEEGIRECEKDDSWILNEDGSMTIDFGEDTGTGECELDGLTDWNRWEIDEEEMTFTRFGEDIFTGAEKVEEYDIEELTTEEMVLSNTLDMTAFGYSDSESFTYSFEAAAL